MTALLDVRGLRTAFRTDAGTFNAVDGVSFSLEAGRTLGIVGESGSGKSVLSRSIMGLLPKQNVVREGSVAFEGTEITMEVFSPMGFSPSTAAYDAVTGYFNVTG